MTLKSMTGFGRSEGSFGQAVWAWEVRAVNGKGLDLRLRLPNTLDRLEPIVRKTCAAAISRGNLQVNLAYKDTDRQSGLSVNEEVLANVLKALATIKSKTDVEIPNATDILNLRGVVEYTETTLSDAEKVQLDEELIGGLKKALSALNEHRGKEGTAVAEILLEHASKIEALTEQAENDPSRSIEAITESLQKQLKLLLDKHGLDETRLHQEAALLATKADIREELDRLAAHAASARELIAAGSPVGRKLEFLAQEFNRESNTLCSKSNSVSLTDIGLELKVVIDQFREQILNVE